MKFLQLGIIIIVFFSCSSKKRIIKNDTDKIKKTTIVKDNISKEEHSQTLISKTSITSKPEQTFPLKSDSITAESNQILYKPFENPHELWNNLLKKYVLDNGKVNYKGLKNNRIDLYNYFKVLNVVLPNESHSKDYKLAYWINAYNAMTLDLILRNYPIKSIKSIEKPWEQRHWKLGDKWYNLNEIEHEILRKMNEPRIHFAIVCASISCPKLSKKAYTPSNLEKQLTDVTKAFLNDPTKNNLSQNNLKLSKIFQWFAKDFKEDGSLIDFLNKYSETKISIKAKKNFKNYNWDLNE